MNYKDILLALDMDGTLTLTAKLLREEAKRIFVQRQMWSAIKYIRDNPDESTLIWPKYMRDVTDEIVVEGTFMLRVEPSSIIQHGFLKELGAIRGVNWNKRLRTCVCTHRGFHAKGGEYTEQWLEEQKARHVIDEVHAIDPAVHPNKLEYLTSLYPDHDILLLDDNPLYRTEGVHAPDPRLCIVNEEGPIPCYADQIQFPGVLTYSRFLRDKLLA